MALPRVLIPTQRRPEAWTAERLPGPESPGRPGSDPGAAACQPTGCTGAQLRRFIKSRPYIPLHELRRRFELNGEADDVSLVETPAGHYFLGLPGREAQLIAELVAQGEVGLEVCRDPSAPVVVGVFAMRPTTRG